MRNLTEKEAQQIRGHMGRVRRSNHKLLAKLFNCHEATIYKIDQKWSHAPKSKQAALKNLPRSSQKSTRNK